MKCLVSWQTAASYYNLFNLFLLFIQCLLSARSTMDSIIGVNTQLQHVDCSVTCSFKKGGKGGGGSWYIMVYIY